MVLLSAYQADRTDNGPVLSESGCQVDTHTPSTEKRLSLVSRGLLSLVDCSYALKSDGIQEVVCSIPIGSTTLRSGTPELRVASHFSLPQYVVMEHFLGANG